MKRGKYIRTKEMRLKISGKKNGMWKGDEVKYTALHDYIKYYLPRPKICCSCKKEGYIDIHNISGKYMRNFSDWEWICRSCHMKKDGRMFNLKQFKMNKLKGRGQ